MSGLDLNRNLAAVAWFNNPVKLTGNGAASGRLDAEYLQRSVACVCKPEFVLNVRSGSRRTEIVCRRVESDRRHLARLELDSRRWNIGDDLPGFDRGGIGRLSRDCAGGVDLIVRRSDELGRRGWSAWAND